MKKPGDKRGGLQGDRIRPRSFHTRETVGVKSYCDQWMENLSEEVSSACAHFWTLTPDRRAKEAKRKAAGFIGFAFQSCKKNPPDSDPKQCLTPPKSSQAGEQHG